jgi:hypothetical protein
MKPDSYTGSAAQKGDDAAQEAVKEQIDATAVR